MLPVLADLFGVPLILALIVIAIGLLLVRFVIGAAITLVKIAIIVGIGFVVYLAVMWVLAQGWF